MVKRDWQADWERCERATSGPWRVHKGRTMIHLEVGKRQIVEAPYIDAEQDEADFEFMANAREALPYWLERVRELEEALMQMFGTTDVRKARSDLAGISRRLETIEKQYDELEAENARLKAVAEAAKEYLTKCQCDECAPVEFEIHRDADGTEYITWEQCAEACLREKLREALAALEGLANARPRD